MTWAALIANGEGNSLRYRLMIEGWPEVFVTDDSITFATNKAGRTVLSGLSYDGMKVGDRCLPWEGKLQADGNTFKITPTYGERTSETTGTDPILASLSTWADPVDALAGTGIWNAGDPGFPDTLSGTPLANDTVYHVGTEAILVGTWPACTRGYWGTITQQNTSTRVDETTSIYIYNRPPTMEGRRAYLYVYGDGDDVAGNGTILWRGVVSRPPRQHSDGVSWLIECLPVTHWLKQTVGGGFSGGVKPMMLYFNWRSAFFMRVEFGTSNVGVTGSVDIPVITGVHTESSLIDAVNTALAAALVTTGASAEFSTLRLAKDSNGWCIEAQKIDSTPCWLSVDGGSLITGYVAVGSLQSPWYINLIDFPLPFGANLASGVTFQCRLNFWNRWFDNAIQDGLDYKAYTADYVAQPLGAASAVMDEGYFERNLAVDQSTNADTDWPANRIYVDHDMTGVASVQLVGIQPSTTIGGVVFAGDDVFEVTGTGTTTHTDIDNTVRIVNYIELGEELAAAHSRGGYVGTVTGDTEIKIVRTYSLSGSVVDFRDALVAQSVYANDGDTPWITDSDLADWGLSGSALASEVLQRRFVFTKSLSVEQILVPELQLAAHFMRIEADGRIGLQPISIPTDGRATARIDHGTVLTPPTGQWPGCEPQKDGFYSSLSLQQIYNPLEDTWVDEPVTVQVADAVATHKNRGKGRLEIKTYSTPVTMPDGTGLHDTASALLRQAAVDYMSVTVQVPWTMFGVLCGDFVTLTHRLVPEGDGTRGVQDRTCFVVERKWNLDPSVQRQGTFTLWMPVRPVAGYAPSGHITSQVGADDAWTLTLDSANVENIMLSTNLDGNVAGSFRVGDFVRVIQEDSYTPIEVRGNVTAVSGDTLTVAFDAPWDPTDAPLWVLEFQADNGSTATATQRKYAYVAGADQQRPGGGYARRLV